MRELGLEIILHVIHHAGRAARRGGDVEAVIREPSHHAVVVDEAVLPQHDPVAAAAGGKLLPRIGIEQFHKDRGVGSDYLDLAERRRIEDAGRLSHRATFPVDGSVHVLARAREIPGAFPLADVLEHGTVRLGPAMHGRAPRRVEQAPSCVVDDRTEGHRRIRRSERRQADLGDGLAERLGCNGKSVQV